MSKINENLKKYIGGVLSGDIVSGKLLRLAVERFNKDIKRHDMYYDQSKVDDVVNFISNLEHSTGQHEGGAFELEMWQYFIIANIYGFYWKKTGLRRFTSSYLEVARKQGKSALAIALCLYHLMADGEGNSEVLLAANSRGQASHIFKLASQFVSRFDPRQQYLKPYRSEIRFKGIEGVMKVLASDSSKLDGFNASFALVDEYHAAKTSAVKDVLQSSMGMRTQPHLMIITTAGFDVTSPCKMMHDTCSEILHGLKEDDSQFCVMYALDKEDDWKDSKNWLKSNPNMGVTVLEKYLHEQVNKAVNTPSEEVGVKTKNFNIWCDSASTWIPSSYILSVSKKTFIQDDIFKDKLCYVGIDLASVTDITALSFMFIIDNKYYFFNIYYLPEDSLNSNIDKEKYKNWAQQGFLTLTPGNVTDYDYVMNDILSVRNTRMVYKVGYDSYNATQFIINCTNNGLNTEPVSQSIGNFNRPTREFERALLSENVIIEESPVTRWMLGNVTIKNDHNGNVKPDKSASRNKIDGVISMLTAIGIMLNSPSGTISSH